MKTCQKVRSSSSATEIEKTRTSIQDGKFGIGVCCGDGAEVNKKRKGRA